MYAFRLLIKKVWGDSYCLIIYSIEQLHGVMNRIVVTPAWNAQSSKKKSLSPGIEPGHTAPEADALSVELGELYNKPFLYSKSHGYLSR